MWGSAGVAYSRACQTKLMPDQASAWSSTAGAPSGRPAEITLRASSGYFGSAVRVGGEGQGRGELATGCLGNPVRELATVRGQVSGVANVSGCPAQQCRREHDPCRIVGLPRRSRGSDLTQRRQRLAVSGDDVAKAIRRLVRRADLHCLSQGSDGDSSEDTHQRNCPWHLHQVGAWLLIDELEQHPPRLAGAAVICGTAHTTVRRVFVAHEADSPVLARRDGQIYDGIRAPVNRVIGLTFKCQHVSAVNRLGFREGWVFGDPYSCSAVTVQLGRYRDVTASARIWYARS
jgi:hypothetical protein